MSDGLYSIQDLSGKKGHCLITPRLINGLDAVLKMLDVSYKAFATILTDLKLDLPDPKSQKFKEFLFCSLTIYKIKPWGQLIILGYIFLKELLSSILS